MPVGREFGGVPPEAREKKEKKNKSWKDSFKVGIVGLTLMLGGEKALVRGIDIPTPEGQTTVEKVDQKEIEKGQVYGLLDALRNLPDNPNVSAAQNEILKKRAAESLIRTFALHTQTGQAEGIVTPETLREAFDTVNSYLGTYGKDRLGASDEVAGFDRAQNDPKLGPLRAADLDNQRVMQGMEKAGK